MPLIKRLQLPPIPANKSAPVSQRPAKLPPPLKPEPRPPLKPRSGLSQQQPSPPSKVSTRPAKRSPAVTLKLQPQVVKPSPEKQQIENTDNLPIEMRRVDELTEHPLHAEHFPLLSEAELQTIAESMQTSGQRDPIHILPNGVILDGRHRRLAAIKNEWAEVKVVVHHELAQAGEEAIEAFLIDCNASRRQLSRLQQARLYIRLRELRPCGAHRRGQGELRDDLAKRFKLSGRNLDRYVTLLSHPPELQSAVERGDVSLVKALQLMKLPPTKHRPILAKLRKGESVKKEVNKLLLYVTQHKQLSKKQLARILRDFIRSGFDVESHFDAIALLLLPQHRQKLLDLGRLVVRLESQIAVEDCGTDSPE